MLLKGNIHEFMEITTEVGLYMYEAIDVVYSNKTMDEKTVAKDIILQCAITFLHETAPMHSQVIDVFSNTPSKYTKGKSIVIGCTCFKIITLQ